VYSDKLFAEVSEFLVTPLMMGSVCLISHGQFEELVRPWVSRISTVLSVCITGKIMMPFQ